METLPLELIVEIGGYLLRQPHEYCCFDDASRAFRTCCRDYSLAMLKAYPHATSRATCCMSVLKACCPMVNDHSDPFDRPLYRCAPFLWVEDWDAAGRRCAMHARAGATLHWCAGMCAGYRVKQHIVSGDSAFQQSPHIDALIMIASCRTFLKQIEMNIRRVKQYTNEGLRPGCFLAALPFRNPVLWTNFQHCMKRWGFHSENMGIRCRVNSDYVTHVDFFMEEQI